MGSTPHGVCKAALLDAEGNEIQGVELADCDEFGGNSLAREVTWKGNNDVSAWAGKPERMKFVMRAMKVFSFQFVESGSPEKDSIRGLRESTRKRKVCIP